MQRVLAAMLLVGLAAACSGDDDSTESATTPPATAATTTEPPPTTAVVPTTDPPPTTAAATTTEPPPTTQAPAPTTEPPPTTTIDPLANLEASIQRDLTDGNEVLQDVLADPTVPDAREQLEPYFSGQALEFLLDLIDTYRADDLTVVRNEEVPASIETVDAPALVAGSEPPTAMVTVCQIDSGILTAPVVDSDLRIPINDDVIRIVAKVTVELVDGIWRMSDGGAGEQEVGEVSCEQL